MINTLTNIQTIKTNTELQILRRGGGLAAAHRAQVPGAGLDAAQVHD
jgi:hypothetical protein